MQQLSLFEPPSSMVVVVFKGKITGMDIPQDLHLAKDMVYNFEDHVLEQDWRLSTGGMGLPDPVVKCLGYNSNNTVLIMFQDGRIRECGPYSLFPIVNR